MQQHVHTVLYYLNCCGNIKSYLSECVCVLCVCAWYSSILWFAKLIVGLWKHMASEMQISWPTLVQVNDCFLTAPSHYLNQCWPNINEIFWNSFKDTVYLKTAPKLCLKFSHLNHSHNELTHWGRDKMAAISQTTLSNAFSWMKMSKFTDAYMRHSTSMR